MSPAPIIHDAATPATPPQKSPNSSATPATSPTDFDDIFHAKFMKIIADYKENPTRGPLTSKDRKAFIDEAYQETDQMFFGAREGSLSDYEIKMRAMTKVFYKVLAEEPWSEEWIRPHDVERKLSRFEMHKDSVELAAQHGLRTPREAITAARHMNVELSKKAADNEKPGPRGPFDDIEIIYIPGTVSSTATNKIDRDTIYPVSVASVANILQMHLCREMTKPYSMAQKFVTCTDVEELMQMRQFACDVCDYAPHLLDNDNVSLLLVLLILTRSEICRRFNENGIRIEGSTISHRRAECLKTKLGWRNADERKPFDNVAIEIQTRIRNACFPAPRGARGGRNSKGARKSSTPITTPIAAAPPMGYFPAPVVLQPNGVHHYPHPGAYNAYHGTPPNVPARRVGEPMDLS
ncbi:hypothetical protein BU24DRAFT_418821 [Aaosphaeria arxii CBS 175.79]|uniref:Uncharacterized protein n=1 Tax=Aaosphaeria arxii CBS 175.79 TaxID=1450172 RepID=A0A6A5Y3Y7_9PLEO|nr:uncharacterized protein BU24DRAFT_418821 [Aaosphaeria arxii CBS 175.79]KAF2019234.1 hypothetical protein BU24DRAFT_418821 [Aaosphaeria arxii CBS 175.79]